MTASGPKSGPDEPIDVLRRHGEPAHFIWHGQLYLVREVIAHWIQVSGVGGAGEVPSFLLRADWGVRAVDTAILSHEQDFERELWSVRASIGRSGEAGVFQLCHDVPDSSWLMVGETLPCRPPADDAEEAGGSVRHPEN
jgi:hypothetical protein